MEGGAGSVALQSQPFEERNGVTAMPTLDEVRERIDALDPQLQDLMMQRMDCSAQVAAAKLAAGNTDVYRPQREEQILERLGAQVSLQRRKPYLAAVRSLIEASRGYQYSLMYEELGDEATFGQLPGAQLAQPGCGVEVELRLHGRVESLATVLGMVAAEGFELAGIEQLGPAVAGGAFRLRIGGDAGQPALRKLLWQLSKEAQEFRIIGSC